jgi:outer membrane protein assembly factor BamA
VLYTEDIPTQTVPAIEDTLFNRGFFDAEVDWEREESDSSVSLRYDVRAGSAWLVSDIRFPEQSDDALVTAVRASEADSLLETGVPYDLGTLVAERERIDRYVRERGFFAFDPSHIVFDANLNEDDHSLTLTLVVEAPESARISYEIDSIAIYADYAPERGLPQTPSAEPVDNIRYYEEHPRFDPEHIVGTLRIRPGDRYDRREHTASLSRLNSMETFRFVNIRYQPDQETGLLHAEVLLTPRDRRSIQGEISAVQRFDGFAGPAVRLSLTDRNLAGGGERLDIGLGASLEVRITGGSVRVEGYEISTDGSIRVPRGIGRSYGRGTQLPGSSIRFSLRRQGTFGTERLDEASAGLAYEWPGRISQQWRPVELTVLRRENAEEDDLRQLLIESSWRANTRGTVPNTDTDYRIAAESTAGFELFDSVRFLRLDSDSRLYAPLFEQALLAVRVRAGAGIAGGSEAVLPDPRRFVVGGSTGMRGFAPGSFGPGTSAPAAASDASGEIRLESSAEYRFPVAGWVYGAVFADAGNTWMRTGENSLRSAGQLFDESAVNAGAGIRIDPGVLVIRLDLGVPLRKPWLETGERWVGSGWDPGNAEWRRENLVINLAIGYPF